VKIAILMLNLGGPEKLEDVRPFLRELFSDREIIKLPGGPLGQWLLSRLIVWRRAPHSEANYAAIGGGSPQLRWTRQQGDGVAAIVQSRHSGSAVRAFPCMRYWGPGAEDALAAATEWGADHLVAFSQYPQRSRTTTGSSLSDLRRAMEKLGVETPLSTIGSWAEYPAWVHTLAELTAEGVAASPADRPTIVYTAHSLPQSVIDDGDPYADEVRQTVEAVHRLVGADLPMELTWQSRVGPIKWLSPSTRERLTALPGEGVEDVVVVPVTFVNEHIETLHELDIELADEAREAGMKSFTRVPAPGIRPHFLAALADLVEDHLDEQGLVLARAS